MHNFAQINVLLSKRLLLVTLTSMLLSPALLATAAINNPSSTNARNINYSTNEAVINDSSANDGSSSDGTLINGTLINGTLSGKPYQKDLDLNLPADGTLNLPELGDASQTTLSAQDEQRIAYQIMRQVLVSDDVLDDIEINDYVQSLGERLAASGPDKSIPFKFFVVKDKSINAFAMPGGVIGVHTGLLVAANTESELASVLGHEIGHVTQHHLARMLASQKTDMFKNIAAAALAILVARSNPQAASGAMVAASASNLQRQLDYSRDHEREADRVGLTILQNAGFDVRGMPAFFTTMQRATRFVDGNTPSYLRTHPLTSERIADMANRVQNLPYKQVPESLPFALMRAKVRALSGFAQNTVAEFENNINEVHYTNEVAEHYGLAYAYLRNNDLARAQAQVDWVFSHASNNAYLETLKATVSALTKVQQSNQQYAQAYQHYPAHKALVVAYADSLAQTGQYKTAIDFAQKKLISYPQEPKLYDVLAKAYQGLNKAMLAHQALSEAYVRRYDLNRAVEQMEIASKAKEGDFYLQSKVEARLKELRRLLEVEKSQKDL